MLALSVGLAADAFAQPPAAPKSDAPYVVEYYYTAKWGYADEFIRLFKKNHYPVLKKQLESGRILKISAVKPRFHATEDGRWDYRVTLVFKNVVAAARLVRRGCLEASALPGPGHLPARRAATLRDPARPLGRTDRGRVARGMTLAEPADRG